ncbi:MAG: aminotransferase class V-fold PLP-dependent enzyme [Kofleriaceae bacterium]
MIYVDNAATTWPKPEPVYTAMDSFTRTSAGNPGRGGHHMAVEAERRVQGARTALGRLVNAEGPERMILAFNATDALNMAIRGVLRPGDHVITSQVEHNSMNRPINALVRAGTITCSVARTTMQGIVPPDEIEKLIRPNTRLIAITHASNVLGVINPIADYGRIARAHGCLLLVDASQTAGVVPIDVRAMQIDLLAFPGHKACFGPMGTGALYVRGGVEVATFREGGTGFASEHEHHPDNYPFHLEAGTPNAHGLVGLEAGLAFIAKTGIDKILSHERALAMRFANAIREDARIKLYSGLVPELQLGPISFVIKGIEPVDTATIMDQSFGIACRAGLHCAPTTHKLLGTFPTGTIRFSFGYFNTIEDVDACVRAVQTVADSF